MPAKRLFLILLLLVTPALSQTPQLRMAIVLTRHGGAFAALCLNQFSVPDEFLYSDSRFLWRAFAANHSYNPPSHERKAL